MKLAASRPGSWRRRGIAAVTGLAVIALTLTACSKKSDKEAGSDFGAKAPKIDISKNGKGVTDNEIKIAFNLTLSACGDDAATKTTYDLSQLDPATKKPKADQYKDEINHLVSWFNDNVEFPKGRKLAAQFVDDFGPNTGCATQARGAGQQVANEIQAFASLGNSTNFDGNSEYAQAANAGGTVTISAASYQVNKDFTERWPYAYGVYQTGESTLTQLTWVIEKRYKGTQYTADDGTKSDRKWGTLFLDNAPGHALSDIVVSNLKAAGIDAKAYFVSNDNAQAGQQAASLVASLKADGINSIVYGAVGSASSFVALNPVFNTQKFFPDWFISDYGAATGLALFNNTLYPEQVKRFQGVGSPSPTALRVDITATGGTGDTGKVQANPYGVSEVQAYKAAGGTLPNPTNGAPMGDFWTELSTLAIGIQNAGDVLNAYTFGQGLLKASSCQTTRFFGSDVPQAPQIKWSSDLPVAMHGYTTIYWDPTAKSLFTSSGGGIDTGGVFQSYDNYKRYLTKDDLPAQPTHDTGQTAAEFPAAEAGDITINSTCKK